MTNILKFLILIFIGLTTINLKAQIDSLLVPFAKLTSGELIKTNTSANQQVVSASRSLAEIKDLPFTIYVVTQKQIQENGYITLVDVLRDIPGVRISQPGSALEGETFLMRGLLGNTYTKILVNDLPVKPSAVRGMPIGAQLPIQHAERIEIIFGSSAAVYGSDASSGVINIITSDSERPFYVQADVALGSQALNHLNLTLGGKMGWDKNVMKFSIFGSFTDMGTRNIFYDEDYLYNPLNYLFQDSSHTSIANYSGSVTTPVIKDFPHQSRRFGVRLSFRGFEVGVQKFYRRDHTAIGLNPTAVSYANPLNFKGENITLYNVSWKSLANKKLGFKVNASLLEYKMDENSSTDYIYHTTSAGVKFWQNNPNVPASWDSLDYFKLSEGVYDKLLSNTRFSQNSSNDLNTEALISYNIDDWIEMIAGASMQISGNTPYIDFLPVPFSNVEDLNGNGIMDSNEDLDIPLTINKINFNNLGLFYQAYIKWKKFNLIAGLRTDQHSQYGNSFSPRIAGIYKTSEQWSIRTSFGRAFRAPTSFYNNNTFAIFAVPKIRVEQASRVDSEFREYEPEKTNSLELGLRWTPEKKWFADVSAFYTNTKNLISQSFAFNFPVVIAGYFNDSLSQLKLYGIQGRIEGQGLLWNGRISMTLDAQVSKGSEILPFNLGKIEEVRGQPNVLMRLNANIRFTERWRLNLTGYYQSEWVSRRTNDDFLLEEPTRKDYIIPGFATMSMLMQYRLAENFQGFMHINNIFGTQHGGIGANGFVDDLIYNPQPLASLRMGLNYRIK